jgi:OOP family OmpA-OmpF porin
MGAVSKSPKILLALALLAGTATGSLAAQEQAPNDGEVMATVVGTLPSPDQMTKGPKVEGIIAARTDGRIKVATADGNSTTVAIADYTKIKSSGGFLGLDRDKLGAAQRCSTACPSPSTRCSGMADWWQARSNSRTRTSAPHR